MSDRIPYPTAREVAERILKEITPAVIRAAVAGSVRRQTPDCKDVELVVVPQVVSKQSSILDEVGRVERHAVDDWTDFRLKSGLLGLRKDRNGRTANGPKYKRLVWNDAVLNRAVPLDLFCVVAPASWGCVFAVRSGPAEFSHGLAIRARSLGLRLNDGHLERSLPNSEEWATIPTPEEKDLFDALGMAYEDPWNRKVY